MTISLSSMSTLTSGYHNCRVTLPFSPEIVRSKRSVSALAPSGIVSRCSVIGLVDVGEHLPAETLLSGLVVAHHAVARRDDKRTVIARREESLLPFFVAVGSRRIAGFDDATAVDLSFEVDLEPAGFAVVDELEAIDIPSIVDDFEHRADRVRG